MKEMIMMKETYKRSSLIITEFSEDDVIATSGVFRSLQKLLESRDNQTFGYAIGDEGNEVVPIR